MLYTDVRYLKQVSYRLGRFKIKKDDGNSFLANCRCPICGDSEKNTKKTRGYFYSIDNQLNFKCHNCNASLSFSKWLEDYDSNLYSMYAVEVFKEKHGDNHPTLPAQKIPDLRTKPYRPSVLEGLKSILQLSDDHPAKKYVIDRKIPSEYLEELYYAPQFFKWTLNHMDKFKNVPKDKDHPRLIIPWFTRDTKECFMYQARAFGDETPKYYSIHIDKKQPQVFGLDRVDYSKRIYVVEGPIDSLFLGNGVAVGSSALHMFEADSHTTYVVDNENRNKEILKEYEKLIKMGKDVCIWPATYKYKDINDAVKDGVDIFDIKRVIDDNTLCGLAAEVRFNEWKRRASE